MDSDKIIVCCMVAGRNNGGKDKNPMWGSCRYCCSYCWKTDAIFVSADYLEYDHVCRKKCTRDKHEFCAWRTDPETMVFIDLFGTKFEEEVYKANVKKREKWVGS